MRKRILSLTVATLLTGGMVAAVNINPAAGVSDLTQGDPSLCNAGSQLRAFWNGGDPLNNDYPYYDIDHISSDNGTKYDATQTGSYNWKWIMVRLTKSGAPMHSTTVNWEAYTDSVGDYPCKVYVWDNDLENFVLKDGEAPYYIFTTHREFDMEKKYWGDNGDGTYDCVILVDGFTETGLRDLHVDVVDADY